MKRFLSNLSLFLALSFGAYLALWIWCNVRNVRDLLKVDGCEVLSPCNSHEQFGIATDLFPEYANFNSVASQPWIWEAKFRLVLDTCRRRPKYVLIDRGSHEPLWGYDSDEVAELVARFLPLELKYSTCPYPIDWTRVLHYAVGLRSFSAIWAANPADRRPGVKLDVEFRVREHFAGRTLPDEATNAKFVRSLERLIELAHANGVEPVLITTPKYRDYLAAEPPELKDFNRRVTAGLIEKYSVRYLDYSACDWDESHYFDADHLSRKGRERLTAMIKADLGY